MNSYKHIERISSVISSEIEEDLNRCGLFFRIFSRVKTANSIQVKMSMKSYSETGKKMQDIIGIRVVLYFSSDIEMVQNYLERKFVCVDKTIDKINESDFRPQRTNLVFNVPEELSGEFRAIVEDRRIDCTFEVQLRTVFSEGWHEVEHDLRYKRKTDWNEFPNLSRRLNGVLAVLETCDWAIQGIFETITYEAYQDKNWEKMIRNHFLIRFDSQSIGHQLEAFLNENPEFSKMLLKISREKMISLLLEYNVFLPLSIDNFIHTINFFHFKNSALSKICPDVVRPRLEEAIAKKSTK